MKDRDPELISTDADRSRAVLDASRRPFDGITRAALLIVIVLGIVFRSLAVGHNDHPHGDVHLDAITLRELAAGNGLTTPLVRSAEYRDSAGAASYPLDQHPPLALFVGLALGPLANDAYEALQYGSLLASLALLVAIFALCRGLLDADRALFATAVCAASFALIDFAGNGAVYSLHALLAVLAVWALGRRGVGGAALSGVMLGLAYLTNYQALVFLPAAALAIAIADRDAMVRSAMPRLVALGLGFAATCAPWWWRNATVFGDMTYSVNPFYLKWKLGGVPSVIETADTTLFAIEWPSIRAVVKPLLENCVVNARFIATQSTLWCGSLLMMALAAVPYWWRRGREQRDVRALTLLAFALIHLLIMVVWPGCKFRYFVPWIPLVAALGCGEIANRSNGGSRRFVLLGAAVIALIATQMIVGGRFDDGAVTLAGLGIALAPLFVGRLAAHRVRYVALSFLAIQAVLFVASPTRTAYYDAILIRDQFRERGTEARDRARQSELVGVAEELAKRNVGAIVADVELAYHAMRENHPLVVIQPPTLGDPAVEARALEKAMRRHGARYILALDEDSRTAYSTFPGFEAALPILEGRAHLLRFRAP